MTSLAWSALVTSALAYSGCRGVVLGEEGEHGTGPLASGGHVVLFKGDLGAVVADAVEVQVEPVPSRVQPDLAALSGQAFEQSDIGGAFHPVGVAGEVCGLGDGGEPERQAEAGIGAEGEGVGGPAPPGAFDQQ